MHREWHGVYDPVVMSVVEACADHGGVMCFMPVSILAPSIVLGHASMAAVQSVLLHAVCFSTPGCRLSCCDVV